MQQHSKPNQNQHNRQTPKHTSSLTSNQEPNMIPMKLLLSSQQTRTFISHTLSPHTLIITRMSLSHRLSRTNVRTLLTLTNTLTFLSIPRPHISHVRLHIRIQSINNQLKITHPNLTRRHRLTLSIHTLNHVLRTLNLSLRSHSLISRLTMNSKSRRRKRRTSSERQLYTTVMTTTHPSELPHHRHPHSAPTHAQVSHRTQSVQTRIQIKRTSTQHQPPPPNAPKNTSLTASPHTSFAQDHSEATHQITIQATNKSFQSQYP